jgi:uncharacterized protein DUF4232
MAVTLEPEPASPPHLAVLPDPEALIQEARRRARRRRLALEGAVTVLAAAAVVAASVIGRSGAHREPRSSSPLPGLAPRCDAGQVRFAASFYGEAGGQFTQTLTLTNVSRHACRISGWPRLAAVNGTGRVGTRRVIQSSTPPFKPLPLRPGGAASFDLYGADWNAIANRPCPSTNAISVIPPGGISAVRVALKIPNCPFGFDIAPLVAGRTDRDSWSVVWPLHRR